ncbi:MAG TPA: BrxE family protein [Herpetosiphonaceae bacterium]|nr:BrxE family protein [Herpetosiphonaceae bacterium]
MEPEQLEHVATLRAVVGYLGEREQYGWWQSSFFAPHSAPFLQPVFARTELLARCNGVTRAAALIHDERIGTGNVYHLFRLPEDLERAIHTALLDADAGQRIMRQMASMETAMAFLRQPGQSTNQETIGPTHAGTLHDLRRLDAWSVVAGHYAAGFEQGRAVFPFFAGAA